MIGDVNRDGNPDLAVVIVDVDGATGAVTVEFSARVPLVWANEATSGFGGGIPVTARTTAVSPLR